MNFKVEFSISVMKEIERMIFGFKDSRSRGSRWRKTREFSRVNDG
jgi:hypothetical protein